MREVVSRCPYFIGQSQINRVPEDRTSGVMSLTYGNDRFVAKLNLNTRICAVWRLAKSFTTTQTQSGAPTYSLCREQNPLFLVLEQ